MSFYGSGYFSRHHNPLRGKLDRLRRPTRSTRHRGGSDDQAEVSSAVSDAVEQAVGSVVLPDTAPGRTEEARELVTNVADAVGNAVHQTQVVPPEAANPVAQAVALALADNIDQDPATIKEEVMKAIEDAGVIYSESAQVVADAVVDAVISAGDAPVGGMYIGGGRFTGGAKKRKPVKRASKKKKKTKSKRG
jgi:hypothetical protein